MIPFCRHSPIFYSQRCQCGYVLFFLLLLPPWTTCSPFWKILKKIHIMTTVCLFYSIALYIPARLIRVLILILIFLVHSFAEFRRSTAPDVCAATACHARTLPKARPYPPQATPCRVQAVRFPKAHSTCAIKKHDRLY